MLAFGNTMIEIRDFPQFERARGSCYLKLILQNIVGSNYVPGLYSKVPRGPHDEESQVRGSCLRHANLGNELIK